MCSIYFPLSISWESSYFKVISASILKCYKKCTTKIFNDFLYMFNCSIYVNKHFLNTKATIMLLLVLYFSVDPCLIFVFISMWTYLMSFIHVIVLYIYIKSQIWCWTMLVPYLTYPDFKEKRIENVWLYECVIYVI
jgi:hypothetical protein